MDMTAFVAEDLQPSVTQVRDGQGARRRYQQEWQGRKWVVVLEMTDREYVAERLVQWVPDDLEHPLMIECCWKVNVALRFEAGGDVHYDLEKLKGDCDCAGLMERR